MKHALAVLLSVSDHPFTFPQVAASARRVLGSDHDGPCERVGPHGWAILELPN
jgi:hypothetical protein